MKIDNEDVKIVAAILMPNEKVFGTVRQRRIGPGGTLTVPTSVILTDTRVIIVNRATLGMRHDYEAIPYSSISTVRLEQGLISSTVFIRVEGYDRDRGLLKNGREEGEIDGLHSKDAKELSNFINERITHRTESQATQSNIDNSNVSDEFKFCGKCGAQNRSSDSFCSKCGAKLK